MHTTEQQQHVGYTWKYKNHWNKLEVKTGLKNSPIQPGSGEEEFITEHYWGYTTVNENMCGEYQVAHPSWYIYPVEQFTVDCDFEQLYGGAFGHLKIKSPYLYFWPKARISVYTKRG